LRPEKGRSPSLKKNMIKGKFIRLRFILIPAAIVGLSFLGSVIIASQKSSVKIVSHEQNRWSTLQFKEEVQLLAEIANTQDKIRTGLMYRKTLGKNRAMLFIFPKAGKPKMWMKNMLFPISMIFLNEERKIVGRT
jgi:hypothetical protein